MKTSLALLVSLAACASGGNGERGQGNTQGGGQGNGDGRSGFVTTPGFGNTQNIRMEASGRVFGENFEFATTDKGYRGLLRGELTYMESSDGRHIVGSWGGVPIDLHVEYDGVTVRARGMFAGRLGRLQFDATELTSTFGRCSMQLTRHAGLQYFGKRGCQNDGWIAPAFVSLPDECVKLPIHRLVMLLTTLVNV